MNKSYLKAFVKIIFLIILLTLCSYMVISIITSKKANHEEDIFMDDFFDKAKYDAYLKNTESDIDGMSLKDLADMGLDTSRGADSDMDGLTDKEEIEVYGSDPTLPSTAGDLYLDGYKIAHGMAIEQFYNYANDLSFPDNTCEEISLEMTVAEDANACIEDYTTSNFYTLDNKDVIKIYSISFYSGHVTIDLANMNIDLSDIEVYVQPFYNSKAKKGHFNTSGNKIILKETYSEPYIVFIVKKNHIVDTITTISNNAAQKINGLLNTDISFGNIEEKEKSPNGILFGSWLLGDIHVWYADTGNIDADNSVRDTLLGMANDILRDGNMHKEMQINDKNIEKVSQSKIDAKKQSWMFKQNIFASDFALWSKYAGSITDISSYGFIYTYYVYDTDKGSDPSFDAADQEEHVFSDFNANDDILPFANFGTDISNGGVCAGIAHLTSCLHNNGRLDQTSATFNYNDTDYSWDITTDAENSTLLDKGLSDYKSSSFPDLHKDANGIVNTALSNGEEDFITMLSYFKLKGNSSFKAEEYAKGLNGADAGADVRTVYYYDGTLMRNIIDQLDQNRMVDAYLLMNNGSGHAVNIYSYTKVEESPDCQGYCLFVYDSNHPTTPGFITAEVHQHSNGQETMYYKYQLGDKVYANSGNSVSGLNIFVALTSEFEILNN